MNKSDIWEGLKKVKMPDDMKNRIEEKNLHMIRSLYNECENCYVGGFRVINRIACVMVLIVLLIVITCGSVVYAYVCEKKSEEREPNYVEPAGCVLGDTISDKYNVIKYNGVDYLAQGIQVDKEQIGKYLTVAKAYMYDESKGYMRSKEIKIYSLIGDRDEISIVADFEGALYIYTISTVTQKQIEEVEIKLLRNFEKISKSAVYEGCVNYSFTKVIQLPARERINCYVAIQIVYKDVEKKRQFLDVNVEIVGITSNGKEVEYKNLYLNGKNTETGIYKAIGIGIDEYFIGVEWNEVGTVKTTGTIANYNCE